MRHSQKTKKLHRTHSQRDALFQALAVGLIEKGRIRTTVTRAKAMRPFVERLIARGRREGIASLRGALRVLPKPAAMKLVHEIAPRFKDKSGGYTRITKLPGVRKDRAVMAVIELTA